YTHLYATVLSNCGEILVHPRLPKHHDRLAVAETKAQRHGESRHYETVQLHEQRCGVHVSDVSAVIIASVLPALTLFWRKHNAFE
ncbi:hypothetical protein ACJEP1_25425, partial [Klebsiella pneumoniae]|uniref:hypothetical protein n=1 Tax=Klebsiella pneumoniae TaxID=573 RepID=UPI00387189C8